MEEAKNPNAKCKVVIKESMTMADAKNGAISDSKVLLEKVFKFDIQFRKNNLKRIFIFQISAKLGKEELKQFKLSLQNFYEAKKSNDNERKIKYYRIMRSLFENDLEFFVQIESFIKFNGIIKESSEKGSTITKALIVKRKKPENE